MLESRTEASQPTDSPFEGTAADYDDVFTHSVIGTAMRRAVWRRFDARFQPGHRVLELGCGTGEDALYLARRGLTVVATDGAAAMAEHSRAKIEQAGLDDRVEVHHLAMEQLTAASLDGPFDGVYSNFGALNCVGDLRQVGRALEQLLQPGAPVVLCVMGPLVPWEWLWFLLRGRPRTALRRLRRGGVDWRGMRIHYPSISTLRRALGPKFELRRLGAVGALLPPSYAESWAARHPRTMAWLDRWERRLETWPPLPQLADHYLIELEYRP